MYIGHDEGKMSVFDFVEPAYFGQGSCISAQKVSEYDKEMPQSHTTDQNSAPLGRAKER